MINSNGTSTLSLTRHRASPPSITRTFPGGHLVVAFFSSVVRC
ncbi:hypothetical protein SLEP1_g33447 [Rubroshorea leprosula]|uniref:Uncharacterized protein n=1 Tax=Rubroshorea leprosula TaxID=152421 RepID=A0AAV5KGT2_9ROSI|nr:hypothetical protein SLEP1_g33447 [Rubroshorea leprosula]